MKKYCRFCEKEVACETYPAPEHSPHYARLVCKVCRRFIGWLPKPRDKDTRRKASQFSPLKLDIGYCELCGRQKEYLGKNETLEIHHKIPVSEGGEDKKNNVLVLCTACHRIAHWVRTYLNYHLSSEVTEIEE